MLAVLAEGGRRMCSSSRRIVTRRGRYALHTNSILDQVFVTTCGAASFE